MENEETFSKHIIKCVPRTIYRMNIQDIKPNKRSSVRRADDTIVIINTNDLFEARLTLLVTLILFYLFNSLTKINLITLIPALPTFVITTILWAKYYLNPPANIVLNRIDGTISYPKKYFYRTPINVLFSELVPSQELSDKSYYVSNDYIRKHDDYKRLYYKHNKTNTILPLLSVNIDNKETAKFELDKFPQILSFFTWYMDKNRPLPPGTAFDSFRQKDFDRRRNKGFQPPLYESLIETPETNN